MLTEALTSLITDQRVSTHHCNLHIYIATTIRDNTHGQKASDDKIHKLQLKLNSWHILTVCGSVNSWSHSFCNTWYFADFHNSPITSTGTIIIHWKEKMYTISKSLLQKIQKYCIWFHKFQARFIQIKSILPQLQTTRIHIMSEWYGV